MSFSGTWRCSPCGMQPVIKRSQEPAKKPGLVSRGAREAVFTVKGLIVLGNIFFHALLKNADVNDCVKYKN